MDIRSKWKTTLDTDKAEIKINSMRNRNIKITEIK